MNEDITFEVQSYNFLIYQVRGKINILNKMNLHFI